MKKFIPILTALFVLALVSLACQISTSNIDIGIDSVRGSGNVIEEQRPVSGIKSVRLANQGDVFIELGQEEELVIEAEDNLLEYITSELNGSQLVLRTRPGVNLRNSAPIRYYLTVTELEELSVSSSGDIDAPRFETTDFRIEVSSSGDVKLDELDVERLRVNISSSGDVAIGNLYAETIDLNISSSGSLNVLGGQVDEQEITISSSGDYSARDLSSRVANVRISSSGSATLRVSDRIDASLSSSGDLYYLGSPSLNARQTSSGEVIQIAK